MSLEVVIGPMFSGKSTYAIQYIRRQKAIGVNVLVLKPSIDTRYSQQNVIVTHDKESVPCINWDTNTPLVINSRILGNRCIVIEEAQFFKRLRPFIEELLKLRSDILVVGLNGDCFQKPFGEILECIPLATSVLKLSALCSVCRDGTTASYTIRLTKEDEQVIVGGSESYISVCNRHLHFPEY
jgi:thymidine kinase